MRLNSASSDTTRDAVEILCDGFLDDPFYMWVAPDPAMRITLLKSLFTLEVDAAATRGMLWKDDRGVVVLIPPDRQLLNEDQAAEARQLIQKAFQGPAHLLADYKQRLRDDSPDAWNAWYLQYIAVAAEKREQGHGSSLMRDITAEIAGAPLWLHTGRARTVPFYARFGLATVAVTACEQMGPYIYTLWRAKSGD